jgi:hypothetical protein
MISPADSSASASPRIRVELIVEGFAEEKVVRALLLAAGYPADRVCVLVAGGRYRAARLASEMDPSQRAAVLIDLDESTIPDARSRAREQLGNPPIEVFCAVPSIEAWLFADEQVAQAHAYQDEEIQRLLRRLPLPEEIPNPRELAQQVFGPFSQWVFLQKIDVGRAAARSPSLRVFLEGMGKLLDVPTAWLLEGVGRSLGRDTLAGLIREVSPGDTVVWRSADGDVYTANELARHIEEGDEVGRQYSSDLLRISRDFLRRTAHRTATS